MSDETLPDPNSDRGRARACGLALLDASRSYETHTLPAEHTGAALVLALVGRARRLLRAATCSRILDLNRRPPGRVVRSSSTC